LNASQRQNSIVRLQMPAQSPVTLVRIAVEADMLGNKVLESLQQRPVPAFGAQERGEHLFEAAIFVARDLNARVSRSIRRTLVK
jgi:hypothetical protein